MPSTHGLNHLPNQEASGIAIVSAGGGAQRAKVVRLLGVIAKLKEQTHHLRLADRSSPPPPAEDSVLVRLWDYERLFSRGNYDGHAIPHFL